MKVFNKPWMIAGLCVITAGAAGYQVLRFRSGAIVAPSPSSLKPQLSTASAQTNAVSWLIDRGYVRSHLAQWIEGPRRDPFVRATAAEYGATANSPVSRWKLKAIWRQTGSSLVVINNGVYAEGDLIEGYRLERIESNGVWLRGPTGREGLGFPRPKLATEQNAKPNAQPPNTINFSYENTKLQQ